MTEPILAPPAADGTRLLPVATARRTRVVVRAQLGGRRGPVLRAVACLVGAAGCGLLAPPLLGRVIDRATAGSVAVLPVLLLAVAAIAQAGLSFAGLRLVGRVGEEFLATTRETFVDRALDLPLERVERGGSGDLTSRITEDIAMVSEGVRSAVPEFAQAALTIALTLVGLAALDWRFGLAALVAAVPIQAATTRWYVGRSAPIYAERRRAAAAEQQQLLDALAGATTVRAFGLADEHDARLGRRIDRSISAITEVTYLQTRFFGRLNTAELAGLSAVLVTGFLLVRAGEVSVGTASAAALYFASLFTPVNAVLGLLDTLQSATASMARLIGVTDLPAEPTPAAGAGRTPGDASLTAQGLRYAYQPGHEVLHGIDLAIPAGGRVALVGPSGGGKSTLARMLAGLHPPAAGTVRLGGVAVEDLDPALRRCAIALVTQEVHVFAGTLADDLRLVAPDATPDQLWQVLETAGLADWCRGLPDGLDTAVGQGALELDVVQAQQLALARLALLSPAVAILDEATAEAGSAGSRLLDAAARRVTSGRTSIIVAHRLSQATDADQIAVLDGGRIVEHGSHEELVVAGGLYARLWQAWSANRAEETGSRDERIPEGQSI